MLDTFPIALASAFLLLTGVFGCASAPSSSSTTSAGPLASAERLEILTSDGSQEPCARPTPHLSVPGLRYTLDVSTSTLAFVREEACADATGKPASTTKTVIVSERDRVEIIRLASAVTVVTAATCGADGTSTQVIATREGTVSSWYDDAPGTCFKDQQLLGHDAVDALLTKVRALLK